jgi:CheY-like chemotaxis protein
MSAAVDDTKSCRVLVVEDNFAVAESLRYFLDAHGFVVTAVAGNLKAALVAVEQGGFDVAVLDIRLGADVITSAAERLAAQAIPMIFLSGYADADVLPESLHAYPRLGKPFDPVALIAAIRKLEGGS